MAFTWTTHLKDNVFWLLSGAALLALLWRMRSEGGPDDPGKRP